MQTRVQARKSTPPQAFREYLFSGEHYRIGQRLKYDAPKGGYSGLQLAQAGSPTELHPAFVEHLDQAVTEDRVAHTLEAARYRHDRIEAAIRTLELDAETVTELATLRWYTRPRRGTSVQRAATLHGYSEADAFRREAIRVVGWVWDEIGGLW